jgi:HD superfamily phosphohydrolase
MPENSKSTSSHRSSYKIIHDTIHRTIKLKEPFLSLLETPELQRLNSIHQLGLAYLVFPGANHTRLEHSLGTYFVAESMAKALNLSDAEKLLVSAAGLLHDVGHGPYSHTLEYLFNARLGLSHTDLTKMIILGEQKLLDDTDEKILQPTQKIHEILEKHDIDPDTASKLICNETSTFTPSFGIKEKLPVHKHQQFFNDQRYLFQIIHSSIDADQIDYLLRDSHYTGVAHGVLDFERLMQTIEIYNNDLVVNKHGLSAVEGMLVARALMYSSVYFHKTVRIAELMLSRALERLLDDQLRSFITISEGQLMVELSNMGGLQRELITLLNYRKLFKRVFYLTSDELDSANTDIIKKLENPIKRLRIEDELAERASVPEGHVIIDVPAKELNFSEPRMHETDIKILDNTVKPLTKYTPLARALKLKDIPDWRVMVVTDKKYKDNVIKTAKKFLT